MHVVRFLFAQRVLHALVRLEVDLRQAEPAQPVVRRPVGARKMEGFLRVFDSEGRGTGSDLNGMTMESSPAYERYVSAVP